MALDALHERLLAAPSCRLRVCMRDGTKVTKRYDEVYVDVVALMGELRACGLESRDVVGVLGENSYEWVIADLALLGLDCVSVAVPMEALKTLSVDEIAERYGLSALIRTKRPAQKEASRPWVAYLDDRPVRLVKRRSVRALLDLSPEVFTIVFSSGTSGSRKGLLMTKKGMENTITTSGAAWRVTADDDILIVMPFSNFQQRYFIYMAIWYGFSASAVAPERMFQELPGLAPTLVIGPPSFFEFLERRIESATALAKLPLTCASIVRAIVPGNASSRLRRLLCRHWTRVYGPRVRLMFVGSAPSRADTIDLFQRIGLPLFEVYGLTEFGWISFNLPGSCKTRSVGRPVSGIALRIAEDQEVLVRSTSPQAIGYVFEGTEEQAAVFLPDGEVATGDLGRIDENGFLHLIGRKKNLILTRSGSKINPEEIESAIEGGCPISKAVVVQVGGRATLSCVVWLEQPADTLPERCVRDFVASMGSRRLVNAAIGELIFRPATELSVESGLLTRNYKVNRTAVARRYFSQAGDARG